MGIRPGSDPYGGVNPLIDKMIGNAYDIVKYVARYLKEIRYVAENMHLINEAVNGRVISISVLNDGQSQIAIELDETVAVEDIESISVITYNSGQVFTSSPETFTYNIDNGILLIHAEGPVDLNYAEFKITITMRRVTG